MTVGLFILGAVLAFVAAGAMTGALFLGVFLVMQAVTGWPAHHVRPVCLDVAIVAGLVVVAACCFVGVASIAWAIG